MADGHCSGAKRCTKCKEFKALGEFYKNRAKPDGLTTECKPCVRAVAKAWFEANKDRHRQAARERYVRDPDTAKKRARKWETENVERKRELRRKGYAENREHKLVQSRVDWAKHREKRLAKKKEYRAANPERGAEHVRARQTRKQRAMPVWADRDAIRAIYAECRRISEATGIKHHVDHFYPLKGETVCGLHNEFNLQVIPAAVNQSKHNRLVDA
ncbi:MAG: hypothetical protein K0S48_63 [Ramlibacter sp.]|jgi:hypothetical protein|nr:hypothetical protein [Ramlibacter sp.]